MPAVASIQLLRALSAWMVVYHHYMQYFYNLKYDTPLGAFFSNYGNIGVDVFFIISGFIMFYSQTIKARTARQFLSGRIIRIVPVYWFYTFLAIVVAHFCTRLAVYQWTVSSLIKSLLFIPHKNPTGGGMYPLLNVGWTLNYEMFFYSFLALSMVVFKRYPFIATAIAFIAFPLFWNEQWLLSSILSDSRLNEFSIGIALAYLYCKTAFFEKLNPISTYILIAGLFSILYKINTSYTLQLYASFIVFSALCFEKNLKTDHTGIKFLLLLGDISYSTYLSHTLILFAFHNYIAEIPSKTAEIVIIIAITLCILISSFISYQYIEQSRLFKKTSGAKIQ